MTYKLLKTDEYDFVVIEIQTDKVIFRSYLHDQAYKVYQFLKNGGGFAGFTPDFFTGRKR